MGISTLDHDQRPLHGPLTMMHACMHVDQCMHVSSPLPPWLCWEIAPCYCMANIFHAVHAVGHALLGLNMDQVPSLSL